MIGSRRGTSTKSIEEPVCHTVYRTSSEQLLGIMVGGFEWVRTWLIASALSNFEGKVAGRRQGEDKVG